MPKVQRFRLKFSRGEEVKYISHLDLMRLWERALRRARIPLAYSEGFNPHPQLSLAAPLALGVTSQAELMDIFLNRRLAAQSLMRAASQQLPPGIEITEVQEMGLGLPSLQSQTRYAEYRVELETGRGLEEVQAAIRGLLAAKHLPWQHQRDTGPKSYDLRSLIHELWLIDWGDSRCVLGMKLSCSPAGTGRPEQVATALGFPNHPKGMHRTRLILASR